MAKVEHVFVSLVHRFPMQEVGAAKLIVDKGLKGCIHGKPRSKRQVLLMSAEAMEALNLEPGMVKENFTTRGLDHSQISVGRMLKIGETILEATEPCEPCYRMDEIRNGLKAELRGRRGWLFRVIQGGRVQRGDEIEFTESAAKQAAD